MSAQPPVPKTSESISLILQSMGVEEAESRVVHQLMDLTHRIFIFSPKDICTDFLEGAVRLAEHAGRSGSDLSIEDVKLSIQNHIRSEFIGPPPRELMMELAAERNKEPLPLLTEKFGVRLPPEKFCLTQPNYIVLEPLETEQQQPPRQPMSFQQQQQLVQLLQQQQQQQQQYTSSQAMEEDYD